MFHSITLRLAALFGTASAAVLIAVGLLVGALVEKHFEEMDLDELNSKLAVIRHGLAKIDSRKELGALAQHLGDALTGHGRLSAAIVDKDGRTLFATAGPGHPQPLLDANRGQAATAQPSPPLAWRADGHGYRGFVATAQSAIPGMAPVTVAVAVETDIHEEFMQSFRRTLWAGVALAILVTVLLSWTAARYGLAPVRSMAAIAEGISASRLNDRLPVDSVPAELVSLAQSFNAMLARLEDSFRRLSDFSSDLAHELRTPIGNLMTQTQVALSRARSPEEYREVLYSSLEEHGQLARMITDMLFLAKSDNGMTVPRNETVDLGQETRELFEFYDALAEAEGVTLALNGAGAVRGERLMLRRAISNLLSNAIRHTPRGQSITVSVDPVDGDGVRLRVSNPGAAIPAEHLSRVFERFYRSDPSREKTSEGAGLGLAITKSIVLAHKGTVGASSAGGMTHFEMVLPKAWRAEVQSNQESGRGSGDSVPA